MDIKIIDDKNNLNTDNYIYFEDYKSDPDYFFDCLKNTDKVMVIYFNKEEE